MELYLYKNKLINSFTHTVVFPSCRQTGETVVMGGSLFVLKMVGQNLDSELWTGLWTGLWK